MVVYHKILEFSSMWVELHQ